MSIAAAVLDAVRTEAALHGAAHVTRAGICVGEISGVEPESLRFCLEALVTGTDLEPLAFDIEWQPWQRRCRPCDAVFPVKDCQPDCPVCKSSDTEPAAGDDLKLSFLELEEN